VQKTRAAMVLLIAGMATGSVVAPWRTKAAIADDDDSRITIRDDCDAADPGWTPTGGCALRNGAVDTAEFDAELTSPLANGQLIGHPAWRNDPSYLKIETDDAVRVRNRGGRTHTFTEVADFGGGRVPPLNQGQAMAPECASATNLPPGTGMKVGHLSAGNHKFQCCIHPWMRAIVKVKTEKED